MFYFNLFKADLATERERQLTKGSARKGLNATCGAQFAALPLVKPIFFICASHRQCGSVVFAKSDQ